MGWALKNLSDGQRDEIARSLFVVTEVGTKGWINGLCPLHGDENLSFGYNVIDDHFHCFTTCVKDGDLVDLFCLVEGLDKAKGFLEFKKRFGSAVEGLDPKAGPANKPNGNSGAADLPEVDPVQMVEAYASFPDIPEKWVQRLGVVRGWSSAVIKSMGLKFQTHYRCKYSGDLKPVRDGQGRIVIPIHDKDGILRNLRLYDPAARGKNKIISWGRGIGQNRLYPFPEKGSGIAWLCEGESDMLCARSLGLEAYTQTAKRMKWPADQVRPFKDRDVVICYDADEPGAKYASAAAESLLGTAASVRVISWPEYMLEDGKLAKKHGQDLTDFVVTHKKGAAELKALLPGAQAVDRVEDVRSDGFWEFWGFPAGGKKEVFQPRLLADRLLADNDLVHDPVTELLYSYTGRCFERFEAASLKRQSILYLGIESVRSRYEDAVAQTVALATMESGRQMDDQEGWICLENGMFNIETFELVPHDKRFLATVQLNLAFDPDNPPDPPKRWLSFLAETIQTGGPISQLQEFFGYCLTREVRYDTALFMIGDGGDGKSTTQSVLRELCGQENCSSVSLDGLEDQFLRSGIYGKLVNMSSEVGGRAIESEFFKRIVSGDSINAAFKHKNAFDFTPFCKQVFAVNKMPRIRDNTDGLYRRMLPIWYKRQFLPGDSARDPHLLEKLLDELPGIFGWALAGLVRLRERGCFEIDHEETLSMVSDYRRLNSPIFAFAQDCLVSGDGYTAVKKDIYATYKSYCGKNGYSPSHRENFFQDLRQAIRGLKNSRPNIDGVRTPVLKGVGLVIEEASE